jgi:hypothetical protein
VKFLIISLLLLAGCSKTEVYTGIVHDYIFKNAEKICKLHGGVHYIVSNMTIAIDKDRRFPCDDTTLIRCQDQTLHNFEDGIGYCFIPRSQIKETL